jgi:protein O-GlcNAc transferase
MWCLLLALLVQTGPSLPELKLDAFPPEPRDAISRAHREALARPTSVEHIGALARTLHAWEQWDAAHQTYVRLEHLDPKSFDWHYLDAVVLQRLARHADAAIQLRRALEISPQYLPARVKLAETLLETGRLDESKSLLAAVVKEPAAEPAALLGLGRIAAAEGRHEEAAAHLERAVKLFPQFGAAHYALARSYRALGRADDARRALALHQQHGAVWPALHDEVLAPIAALREDARGHVRRGTKLADEGDLPGAIAAHEAALAVDASLADAHSNLISLYGRAGQWAKAEEHYRAVVAMGVNLAEAHYDYGVLLGLQEKWDMAADAYRQALAVNPLHVQARNNLGQILEQHRQFEDAAGEYRTALESQPGFRLARFNLGRMLIGLGRPGEAASELRKLVEPRDAEAARYLFALSVALVRAGQKAEGIKWAADAKQLALDFGQHELAAAIERDLARLK